MRLAFVMDPIERIDIDKDTTFALMLAAQARGHEVNVLHARDLSYRTPPQPRGGEPAGGPGKGGAASDPAFREGAFAWMSSVRLARAKGAHAQLGPRRPVRFADLDAVLMRSDPPFDINYFMATQMLERARGQTLLINDPRGLREANEKLYALNFSEFVPPTMVTANVAEIHAFIDEQGGEAIIKPLDGCGGMGVFHLRRGDRNLHSLLEVSTDNGRRYVMVQRYLPEVREGDKRIILLDGEPLGAVLRIPKEDETRGNIHVGGRVAKTTLTPREQTLCDALGPRLRADGLYFVGLDVIGGYLTEVNVTSPTGVQEIDRFDGVDLGARVIGWIEARVR